MRNIFKSLLGQRQFSVEEDQVVVHCDCNKDADFLMTEVQEFAYKKDIIVNIDRTDRTLYLSYTF